LAFLSDAFLAFNVAGKVLLQYQATTQGDLTPKATVSADFHTMFSKSSDRFRVESILDVAFDAW
jgi:hypothetical protein